MRLANRLALAVLFAAAACGDDTTQPPKDLSVDQAVPQPDLTMDMATVDAPIDAPIDAPPPVDMAGDMAGLDFSGDFALADADFALPVIIDGGPPPTVITHFRWTSFCEAFTACGFFSTLSMSRCMNIEPALGNLPFAPASTLTCIANAGADCTAIKTCLNNNDPNFTCDSSQGPNPMCTGNGGNVWSECFAGLNIKFSYDCTTEGFTCTTAGTGTQCGFGNCPGNIGQAECAAGFATNCTGTGAGILRPLEDCRVFTGETCSMMTDADAGTTTAKCTGTLGACSADTCNGTTLVACKNGQQATYDCTNRDKLFSCVTFPGESKPTCGYGTACDPATYMDTCSGNTLTFCDAGKVATKDCVADGWKRCATIMSGGAPTGAACSAQ